MDSNAFIANQAYSQTDARVSDVGNFSYRPEVSDNYHAVYHDPRSSQTIMGIRGTADLGDLGSDLAIATGTEDLDPGFQRSAAKLEHVVSTLGGGDYRNVKISGHSLGGQ